MCGICGVFDTENENRVDQGIIQKMATKLGHRGPDDVAYLVKDNIALGFTRLSIIDLEGGMQPIFNEDHSVVLICNGEIFNHRELRECLLKKGHQFKTNSDVEVVLHLYEEGNFDFFNDINGQFAFAIYDFKKNCLLCARDHVGIAPFFYTVVNGIFIFASEIKAILEHPAVKREVDCVGLDQIFTFPGLISPRTMVKNISSLENGHYLWIHDGKIEDHEYWDLIYSKHNCDEGKPDSYYIEKLDDLLTKAVKYRLQADVPVGFYISGGLDSAIIAAKIKQLNQSENRHSFSIDFTDKDFSEGKYQKTMAQCVNSIHHEIKFDFLNISDRLNKVIYHSESALKETYNTASFALSESVRNQKIKVVLTGEGADELFGGYVGYRFDKLRQSQPPQADRDLPVEKKIRQKLWGDENFLYEKNHYAYQKAKLELYSQNINDNFEEINCLNHFVIDQAKIQDADIFQKRSYVDFKVRMTDHLLADHGDRMIFANSVEARYPFLDKDLIEFVRYIPSKLKLRDYTEKYILKRIAENIVPPEIVKRPKFAFVAPGSPALLQQKVEFIYDLLAYDRVKRQGFFNPDMVERLKNQYAQPGFKLNVPYDIDWLIICITFGIFLEEFHITL